MKKYLSIVLLIGLFIMQNETLSAQNNLVLRPYIKIGQLLTPPNTADLGYTLNGMPGGLDDQQTVNTTQFALGTQMLIKRDDNLAYGGQFGFQNLFRSKLTGDIASSILKSNDYDNEWDLYFGPVIEKANSKNTLYVQGGVGLHICFWQYIYDFQSIYENIYRKSGGVYTSFGIHGDIGTKIKFNDRLQVPLAIRTEIIFSYGVLLQIGLVAGLNFQSSL